MLIKSKEVGTAELFGKHLRAFRKKLKMSQAELAERAGCDISSLGRTERGEVSPTVRMVEKYADAFGCTVLELFDFSEQRGTDDAANRLKEQIQVLVMESDPKTLDFLALILADFIQHGRKHRSR